LAQEKRAFDSFNHFASRDTYLAAFSSSDGGRRPCTSEGLLGHGHNLRGHSQGHLLRSAGGRRKNAAEDDRRRRGAGSASALQHRRHALAASEPPESRDPPQRLVGTDQRPFRSSINHEEGAGRALALSAAEQFFRAEHQAEDEPLQLDGRPACPSFQQHASCWQRGFPPGRPRSNQQPSALQEACADPPEGDEDGDLREVWPEKLRQPPQPRNEARGHRTHLRTRGARMA